MTLSFRLERNDSNKKIWAALVRDPFHNPTRRVTASIGILGGVAQPADAASPSRWSYRIGTGMGRLGSTISGLARDLRLARSQTGLLRDGPKPAPFSLGQAQMAWWFFLIIISYVMIG